MNEVTTELPLPSPRPIRVLLVDDHEVVRVGLSTLLGRSPTLEVVGGARSVAEGVEQAAALRPRVVIMDMRLPDGTGVDACREILSNAPDTRILFFTSYSDEEAIVMTIMAGAAGYLMKDIDFKSLVEAIHSAADGGRIVDSRLEHPVREQMRNAIDSVPDEKQSLSPQERRILSLVVEGLTNKEIAVALGLSDKTVKNYLSNAFQKLQVKRRSQAAAIFSQRHGDQDHA